MLDVAGAKNCQYLPNGYEISPEDLEKCVVSEGVNLGTGCVVLVRTGYGAFWNDRENYLKYAVVGKEATMWLARKRPFAVGADNPSFESLLTKNYENNAFHFVHVYLLPQRGIYIIENVNLESLARDHCYNFVFVGLPLKLRGATGSPLRPIALCNSV